MIPICKPPSNPICSLIHSCIQLLHLEVAWCKSVRLKKATVAIVNVSKTSFHK